MFALEHAVSGKIIPDRITTVLQNLQKIHGSNLVIESIDKTEVNFYVRNLTDKQLMSSMMSQTAAIFGASGGTTTGGGCVLRTAGFSDLVRTDVHARIRWENQPALSDQHAQPPGISVGFLVLLKRSGGLARGPLEQGSIRRAMIPMRARRCSPGPDRTGPNPHREILSAGYTIDHDGPGRLEKQRRPTACTETCLLRPRRRDAARNRC